MRHAFKTLPAEYGNKKIILVDHNEKGQAVDGIDEAEILEIIDHHRLGSMETALPVFFRNQPVGCTGTIIYDLYQENNVEVDKKIAGLLCSAIISDTLMFRSPTCTPKDKKAARSWRKSQVLKFRSMQKKCSAPAAALQIKHPKKFSIRTSKNSAATIKTLAQGRFLPMDKTELEQLRPKIAAYMEGAVKEGEMLFFLLTNILTESSDLVFAGEGAKELVETAFGEPQENWVHVPGLVSRKKQFVPSVLHVLQQ